MALDKQLLTKPGTIGSTLRALVDCASPRFTPRRCAAAIAFAAIGLGAIAAETGKGSEDPLQRPALLTESAKRSPMIGITPAGDHLVAVGPRGYILKSSADGHTWTQVASPVSADFTAVHFLDANKGWSVGHDGVVLQTLDGGASWHRRLDGRSALKLLGETYEARVKVGEPDAAEYVKDIEGFRAQSATPDVLPYPFLNVWFENDNEGFVVGAFGLILHTGDGGASWEPWNERADNDRRMHLYAISGSGDQVFLAGEQGLVRKLNRESGRFETIETPYNGTYFGVHVQKDLVIVHGLRGNAYASRDGGKSWQQIETGVAANIVAVLAPDDARLLLVSQAGHVLESRDGGRTVTDLKVPRGGEVFGAAMAGPDQVAMARLDGVGLVPISAQRK